MIPRSRNYLLQQLGRFGPSVSTSISSASSASSSFSSFVGKQMKWQRRSLSTQSALNGSLPIYLSSTSKPACVSAAEIYPTSIPCNEPAFQHLQGSGRSYLLQKFPYEFNPAPSKTDGKIVYEVTLEIDEEIADDYLDWIRSGHIQEALALPGFVSWNVCSVEGDDVSKTTSADGKPRRVIVENYFMESREALEEYFTKYAQPIRDDHTKMWDGKFAASRRILTIFGEQDASQTQLWKDRDARNAFRIKNLTEQVAKMPKYHPVGWEVMEVPTDLWTKIVDFYQKNQCKAEKESINPIEVSINTWTSPTYKLEYTPEIANDIVTSLKTIGEQFSGIEELESTGISGIRFYQPGATIAEHVDLAATNVISVLMNIDQDVKEPWPFKMRNHKGEVTDLHLKPGQMVVYESATCAHYRDTPLVGNYYANTFLRFKPKGWVWDN